MNSRFWLDGIDGIIPGGISIEDFSRVSKSDKTTAKAIIQELVSNDIGKFDGATVEFEDGDKLRSEEHTSELQSHLNPRMPSSA